MVKVAHWASDKLHKVGRLFEGQIGYNKPRRKTFSKILLLNKILDIYLNNDLQIKRDIKNWLTK